MPATGCMNILPRPCWTCSPSAKKRGRLEGLQVAIIGDIAHSRVARSNIIGLKTMGAEVMVAGPPTMIPPLVDASGWGSAISRKKLYPGRM